MILLANGSGWQTQKSYERMMLQYLLPAAIKKRRVSGLTDKKILFVLDSHYSRMSLPVIRYCKRNKISLLTIPAHSSHLTQPLDCGPNGAFKRCLASYILSECCKPEVDLFLHYLLLSSLFSLVHPPHHWNTPRADHSFPCHPQSSRRLCLTGCYFRSVEEVRTESIGFHRSPLRASSRRPASA